MNQKRYGVVPPAEQAALSGLEFVQSLVSGALPHNSMARTLGYDIVAAEPTNCASGAKVPADGPAALCAFRDATSGK